ncbi:DinB family protein [uncultured Psychroserpens sp.]|uniref:DinB family protein n=1 Tax=uncultured Psychroserpens sp. TaxID=255436 RepID=UPI002612578F|nr:DinB family protein [uncultured Psychroserpens sp.]
MTTASLITLYNKDLNALIKEIRLYADESNLWLVPNGISNSAGNLCLHLVGNLNHFIGATLGNSGYVRQRDLEFTQKDVPRTELIQKVEETMQMVTNTLQALSEDDLQQEYKHRVIDKPMTTVFFLMYLAMHLAYHLGQINYHRRLLNI